MGNPSTPVRGGRPARYDDVVKDAADDRAPAAAPATTNRPASAVRDAGLPAPSFFRDNREDDPGDRDRTVRKHPVLDLIAKRLEMEGAPSYDDRFDWCRDVFGRRLLFSRRYSECDVLIDMFAADTNSVRDEVARKRAAIIAHNKTAKIAVEQVIEAAKDDAALEAGMMVLRQTGEVPFGYFPMVGLPLDIDLAALKAGAVLDLPPRAVAANPAEIGAQVGVGVR